MNLFGVRIAGNFKRDRDICAQGRKGARSFRICGDLSGGNTNSAIFLQTVSQCDEAIRIAERQGAEQNAFNQRENGGSRADAKAKDEDRRQSELRRFQSLANCESEIV